jgi:PhnB protein
MFGGSGRLSAINRENGPLVRPPGQYSKPAGVGVTLSVESDADAERIFKALCADGSVGMPIGETFFAHRFGMVTDRYGIPWMIVHRKH